MKSKKPSTKGSVATHVLLKKSPFYLLLPAPTHLCGGCGIHRGRSGLQRDNLMPLTTDLIIDTCQFSWCIHWWFNLLCIKLWKFKVKTTSVHNFGWAKKTFTKLWKEHIDFCSDLLGTSTNFGIDRFSGALPTTKIPERWQGNKLKFVEPHSCKTHKVFFKKLTGNKCQDEACEMCQLEKVRRWRTLQKDCPSTKCLPCCLIRVLQSPHVVQVLRVKQ